MASYNRVIMMGNLTRDPEIKQIPSGQSVCRFGLASNRQFKNKQSGSMVQEVCFIDVDVWGAQADSCKQYLAKGRAVLVEGRLKMDSWQEADGNKRTKYLIVADRVTFLASAQQADDTAGSQDASDESVASGGGQSADFAPATSELSKSSRAKKPHKASSSVEAAPGGEVNLKDQAPFEDDLPF